MPHKDPEVRAAYHAAYEAKRRGTRTAYMAEWQAAHKDQIRAYSQAHYDPEKSRVYHLAHRAEHRDRINANQRAYTARLRAEQPGYHEAQAAYLTAYRAANRERMRFLSNRYRERSIDPSVTWTDIESDECGVCHETLQPRAVWPDPMATTIGHEPPVSRIREGFTEGVRRPEHWVCNRIVKHARLDAELKEA
jgi:hypothetical protein